MRSKITLHKWRCLDRSSVEFEGMICTPVIMAEFHIDGKRQVHCMFCDRDGNWWPVAGIEGAVLHAVDREITEALAAMEFRPSENEWN
jgi:hypothetical protein